MATRTAPDDEVAESEPAPCELPTPVMMWANDSLASLEIVEAPRPTQRDGVCRCEACHASLTFDCAALFR